MRVLRSSEVEDLSPVAFPGLPVERVGLEALVPYVGAEDLRKQIAVVACPISA